MKKKLLCIALSLFAVFTLSACGDVNDAVPPENDADNQENQAVTQADGNTSPEPEQSNETTGQKNALKAGKHYLDTMAFSHSGLIKQLEFEGYSTEDATYAADNCGADWNDQAAKSAKHYLDTMAFSRDSLITQLEYEGFTNDQAVYGAEANGY